MNEHARGSAGSGYGWGGSVALWRYPPRFARIVQTERRSELDAVGTASPERSPRQYCTMGATGSVPKLAPHWASTYLRVEN